MKKLLLPLVLLLAACGEDRAVVASTPRVPELPSEYSKAQRLPPNTDLTMGGQVLDNTSNIRKYNDTAKRYNSLIDLYTCVKVMINEGKQCQTSNKP